MQSLTTAPSEKRASLFKAAAAGKQLGECVGICMTDALKESREFARALDAEESEFLQEHSEQDAPTAGATSAGGRCGWFSTPAALFLQSDFANYAEKGGNHTMVVLHEGNMQSMLLLYPAGPNCRPDKCLPKKCRSSDGQGQPRVHSIHPGRAGISVSNPGNVRLQRRRGAAFTHNVCKAHAALHSLLIAAALGLACDVSDGLLDGALARTMQYTYDVFSKHQTVESAMAALACLKGFYVNRWPAGFHKDKDDHMETWSIRQADPDPLGRTPPCTLVPQLKLGLTADANTTVWTASLSHLMHAALDLGCAIESTGRGANDAFHLQSRGARNVPLWV